MVVNEKYKIVGRIGAGGMGTVYRGEDLYIGRPIAIKFLKPDLLENSEYLERFKREARIASRLNHPNAIAMFDYGVFKGLPYLVMQFVEGKTLKEELMERGALPLDRVVNILNQVGAALSTAHSLGVVHRDLKPDNVMLSGGHVERETALILDFGIAKPLSIFGNSGGQELTRAGVFMGTPLYMSPEQALDRPCDARSDIYALGIILYEMITGEVPFRSSSPVELLVRHINDIPIPIREFRPELNIPPAISDVVAKALEKDPDKRFQSIDELVRKFSAASAGVVKRQPFGIAPRPVAPQGGQTDSPSISGATVAAPAKPPVEQEPPAQAQSKISENIPPKIEIQTPPVSARSGPPPALAAVALIVLLAAGFFGYREFSSKDEAATATGSKKTEQSPQTEENSQVSNATPGKQPGSDAKPDGPATNAADWSSRAETAEKAAQTDKQSENSAAIVSNSPDLGAAESQPGQLPAKAADESRTTAPVELKNEEVKASVEALNKSGPSSDKKDEAKKSETPPANAEAASNATAPETSVAEIAEPAAGVDASGVEQAGPDSGEAGDNLAGGGFEKFSVRQIQSEIAARTAREDRKASDQLYGEGRSLFNSKDYQGAADKFKQSLVTCEANLGARLSLASSLLRLGAQDQALEHFKTADAAQPDYPPTLYGFASYYAIRGDAKQAASYLKRAIALYPKIKNWPSDDSDFDPIRSDAEFQKLTSK